MWCCSRKSIGQSPLVHLKPTGKSSTTQYHDDVSAINHMCARKKRRRKRVHHRKQKKLTGLRELCVPDVFDAIVRLLVALKVFSPVEHDT